MEMPNLPRAFEEMSDREHAERIFNLITNAYRISAEDVIGHLTNYIHRIKKEQKEQKEQKDGLVLLRGKYYKIEPLLTDQPNG